MKPSRNREKRKEIEQMFAATYNKYLPYISSQTLTVTANPDNASEINQNIFIKIWKYLLHNINIPTPNDLKFWIIIFTRESIKKYMREINKRNYIVISQPQQDLETHYPTTRILENPNLNLQYNIIKNNLNNTITQHLTPIQQAITWQYQQGYQINEIASNLQLSTGQTRGHLQRIKTKLRQRLGDMNDNKKGV